PASQLVAREGRAERPEDCGACGFLAHEFLASYETIGERAAVAADAKRAQHSVTVEPVPVLDGAAREAPRAVEIARAAHVRGKAAAYRDRHAGVLVGARAERPFDERRVVDHGAPATATPGSASAGAPGLSGVLKRNAASGFQFGGHG